MSIPGSPAGGSRPGSWFTLPALEWLRGYRGADLRMDMVAGVTLAAYLLPAGLGDASLAGLPPEAGLYACFFAGLVFWLFCGSRRTSITVTSAISLLLGTTLGGLAGGDPARYGALAACTALLVGGLAGAAWLLGAGGLASFVSESVLTGFKLGVACTLASTQLPKLLGISGAHGGFWECTAHLATHLHEANRASAGVGLAALVVLVLGRILLPRKPVALLVVIGGIVAASAGGLDAAGVRMLGPVPEGLPRPRLPDVRRSDLNELLPLAFACFLLAAVETVAIGRMFAARHATRLDVGRELLGLAVANVAAGVGRGFPVSGGLSQSLVNESAGARTPLSGLIASLLMLLVVLFGSGALRNLPQPVLGAIVLMAVVGLVDVRALRHLWRADRRELAIALVAFAGVLASGLLRGVLIGAVISLVLLVHRASRPHVAFLGRIPGTRRYSDIDRHPDNEGQPGLLVFRPESSLLYFNAANVHDAVRTRLEALASPVRLVVCDLSASPHVDLAGAAMLRELEADLRASGVRLRIVGAHADVRDRLRVEGIDERVGGIDRRTSVADAVDAFAAEGGSPAAGAPSP